MTVATERIQAFVATCSAITHR